VREARQPHTPVERVRREKKKNSLSVFSLVPDLLCDCSRVLEYANIRTVLQSKVDRDVITPTLQFKFFNGADAKS